MSAEQSVSDNSSEVFPMGKTYGELSGANARHARFMEDYRRGGFSVMGIYIEPAIDVIPLLPTAMEIVTAVDLQEAS